VTGLYNHRAIHQRLRVEFQRSVALTKPLSIIMMDLNDFKLFNDTYGHPVGDEILKQVARALAADARPQDVFGRYGGDEFIAVLPETELEQAVEIANKLQQRMQSVGFKRHNDERTVPVTLSYGVAAYPKNGTTRHDLLSMADSSLYMAKRSGAAISVPNDKRRALRALCRDSSFEVLDAMVTAVDNKDQYTGHHSEDVTEYALWIADALGMSEESMRVVRIGGLLHDVGKIGVPDEILRKPGRLTPEEYEVMKRHVRIGALMVGAVPGMGDILDAVASHHERWDGTGYPDCLAGEAIPLLGRILAVGDAFSAMTTDRPYRKGLEWHVALEEIRANAGTQFDPAIAHAFLVAAAKYQTLHMAPAPGVSPRAFDSTLEGIGPSPLAH
jgi:diguanylate cyclase (GGDEF)-like protein/putative nucleotidyltransferase with HDIG domain